MNETGVVIIVVLIFAFMFAPLWFAVKAINDAPEDFDI